MCDEAPWLYYVMKGDMRMKLVQILADIICNTLSDPKAIGRARNRDGARNALSVCLTSSAAGSHIVPMPVLWAFGVCSLSPLAARRYPCQTAGRFWKSLAARGGAPAPPRPGLSCWRASFHSHKHLCGMPKSDYTKNGNSWMFSLSVSSGLYLDISCIYMLLTFSATAFLSLIFYIITQHFFRNIPHTTCGISVCPESAFLPKVFS